MAHIMKKTIYTLLFAAACMMGQSVMATRPLRKAFAVKQSDGTSVTVYRQGNGHFGFYSTTDGIALLRGANGDLCYAQTGTAGIEATSLIAHNADQRSKEEIAGIEKLNLSANKAFSILLERQTVAEATTSQQRATHSVGNNDGLGQYGVSANGVVGSIGAPEIPVIMVEFPDRKFQEGTTMEKVSRMLNEPGYADEKDAVGSVKDYFTAQSKGMFTPSFNVVAKMSSAQGYAYYGANQGSNIDRNTTSLIREAIAAAMEQGVDFSKYTVDGQVPLVSIYYAGPGEHSSYEAGCEDYLWAHFSKISNFVVGDVKFASFFVGNELLQSYSGTQENPVVTGSDQDGIGIFIHEFGHALGLPDFYYTGSDYELDRRLETMAYWSVMDYGQYVLSDGYSPIGYNAYERSFMGWLQVEELTTAQYAELRPFDAEEGTTAYCIKSDGNEQEYYLLENRQPSTWYPAELGHGMLITHVDYSQQAWSGNAVNNDETRQRFSYVPADNQKYKSNGSFEGFQGDLFPGTTGAKEFSDETLPAAILNSGDYLGKPIYNIEESEDGVISFSYLDRTLTSIKKASLADDADCGIYTVDGRKIGVLSTDKPEEVLPSGLYILKSRTGSKKVYIK